MKPASEVLETFYLYHEIIFIFMTVVTMRIIVIRSNDNPKIIQFDELNTNAKSYIDNIKKRNNWAIVKFLHKINFFKSSYIYLKDLNQTFSFNLIDGLEEFNIDKTRVDIITDSDSLSFALCFDYGMDSLFVNARFRTSGGKIMNFFTFMFGKSIR